MLKKRIIFTLLHDRGNFMLSRNFRLQKVGDINWLQKNYNFANVACFIDELVVLDVSRGERNSAAFCEVLSTLSEGCFAPIAAGGGVKSVDGARALLRAGADKVVINSCLFEEPAVVQDIASEFGQQCVVGSIDVLRNAEGVYDILVDNGSRKLDASVRDSLAEYIDDTVGELYLNSIDRDGTGQGYDFETLSLLGEDWSIPVIMAGGVGNAKHLSEGLADPRIDAVATANLFNFVGDGLKRARQALLSEGVELASWGDIGTLKGASS